MIWRLLVSIRNNYNLVFTGNQVNSCLQSNIRHPISQRYPSMKVLCCQWYFVRLYWEFLMSQIIQDMSVVLAIWMLTMTTKITVMETWRTFEVLSRQVRFCNISEWYHIRVFEIGETLFLTNDGWSGLVKVEYFSLDKANILIIVVTNTNGDNIVTTKEHHLSPSNPDIGWIPESAPEYWQVTKLLLEEAI